MASELIQSLQQPLCKGEKFKTINKAAGLLTSSEVTEIIQALKTVPGNFEAILKVVDVFKHFPTVLEILEHGTPGEIRKVSKLLWAFQEGSPLTNPGFLISDFFPRVSFISRQRIIASLGLHLKGPLVADGIFKAIEAKYGLRDVIPLLQACGEELIKETIDGGVELTTYQTLAIAKSFPHLGIEQLNNLHEADILHYNHIVVHLLQTYPEGALEFVRKNISHCCFQLGNQLSRRLLKLFPLECIEILVKKKKLFKMRDVDKCLSREQYQEAFRETVMPDAELWCQYTLNRLELWPWLKPLSPSRRFQLVQKAFKASYNKELLDCPDSITTIIFGLLPEDLKSDILERKLNGGGETSIFYSYPLGVGSGFFESKWFWIAMKPIQVSIPELKNLLIHESDPSHISELQKLAVVTCIYHKDHTKLMQVLQLLIEREPKSWEHHLKSMYLAASNMTFKLEHWKSFQKILETMEEKQEVRRSSQFLMLFFRLSEFYKRSESLEKEIENLIRSCGSENLNLHFSLISELNLKDALKDRRLIEAYITALEKIYGPSAVEMTELRYIVVIIKEIKRWNRSHGKKSGRKILWCSYPYLRKRFFDLFTAAGEDFSEPCTIMNMRDSLHNFQTYFNEILKTCITEELDQLLGCRFIPIEVLTYCLKENPERFLGKIRNITGRILSISKLSRFRRYPQFVSELKSKLPGEVKQMEEECLQAVQREPPKSKSEAIKALFVKRNAVALLSVLQLPSEFLAFVRNHFPTVHKYYPEDSTDEGKEGNAGNLAVKLLYTRDYLSIVGSALCSAIYKLPERDAVTYLMNLVRNNYPLSMKKYGLKAMFNILTLEDRTKLLKEIRTKEQHPYLREQTLELLYSHLKTTRSEEVWRIVKNLIQSLTKEDAWYLEFNRYAGTIDHYLGDIATDFWSTILEAVERMQTDINWVVVRIAWTISNIEDELLEKILSQFLLDEKHLNLYDRHELVICYLLDPSISETTLSHRIAFITNITRNLLVNFWDLKSCNCSDEEVFTYRDLLTAVFHGIANKSYRNATNTQIARQKTVLNQFIKLLEEIQDFDKTFKNKFYMQLTLLRLEEIEKGGKPEEQLKRYGSAAATLIKSCVGLHRVDVLEVTGKLLEDAWWGVPEREGHILNIVDGIVSDEHKDSTSLLTAITLLPRWEPEPREGKLVKIYERVVAAIIEYGDKALVDYYKFKTLGN